MESVVNFMKRQDFYRAAAVAGLVSAIDMLVIGQALFVETFSDKDSLIHRRENLSR